MLDASDPGTGKTRVQIEAFAARRKRGGGKALILAPKSLLESAWGDDFHRFAPTVRVSIAFAENREEAFRLPADAYITNIDAVRWLVKQPKGFFDGFETLIIDEATALKHRTSQRSKAAAKIRKHFKYRYGLTGTPNPNTILDIWHPVFLLDDGKRLGDSFFHFRNVVCSAKQVGPMPQMVKWSDKPGAADAVAGLLKDMTIRHVFEECVDIPPNFTTERIFRLSPQALSVYKKMEKDAIVQLQDGQIVTAVNAAVVVSKLLQIASGATYSSADDFSLVDRSRYELVGDLVDERKNSLVFFHWTHQRDELVKEFQARGITHCLIDGSVPVKKRHEAVDLFQKGFYRVLLAHPQSAAHGLTLTRATTTIWASPTFNLEHYLQGNRRIYRAGQTQKTETIVILAEDTIELKVHARMQGKNERQMDLLKLLKEIV